MPLELSHPAPRKPPLQRRALTSYLAPSPVDRAGFSNTIAPFLFSPNDNLCGPRGEEMDLDFYEGYVHDQGSERKLAASASGWDGVRAFAVCHVLCMERGGFRKDGPACAPWMCKLIAVHWWTPTAHR